MFIYWIGFGAGVITDSQEQAQHIKGIKFGLSKNAIVVITLGNNKAQETRELVALNDSANIGGTQPPPYPFSLL